MGDGNVMDEWDAMLCCEEEEEEDPGKAVDT